MQWLVVLALLSVVQANIKDIISSNCTDVPDIKDALPVGSSWPSKDTGTFYEYVVSSTTDYKCYVGEYHVDKSEKCAEPSCYKYTATYMNTTSNTKENQTSYFMIYPDKQLNTYVQIQNNGSSYPRNEIPIVGRCIYKHESKSSENTVYIDYWVYINCEVAWAVYGRHKKLSDSDYNLALSALDHFNLDKSAMTNITQDC